MPAAPQLTHAWRAMDGLGSDPALAAMAGFRRLYVSRRTVQTHLVHVFAKLDISSSA